MPHFSFLLQQLVPEKEICHLQIPSKLFSRCKEFTIEAVGSRADGTEVYMAQNNPSKRSLEYLRRLDTESPLMVQFHKKEFVERENDSSIMQLLTLRSDSRFTHPGYCWIRQFDGGRDLILKGWPVGQDSPFRERAISGNRCSFWPLCAKKWLTRSKDWPSKEIKERVKSDGCMLIYRQHPLSEVPEYEWQYLFSNAEKILFRCGLSQSQKYLFKVFKILVDYQTKHLDVKLHTAHVKTVFFYACEAIREAMFEESPGGCFLYLVESLLVCLRNGNFPNYFVEENNMIDHLERGSIQNLANAIESLRLFPLQCMTFLTSAKGYQRSWLVDVVLKDVETFKNNNDLQRAICKVFVPVMIREAKKLALHEKCYRSCDKIEDARLQLIMAPPNKFGKHIRIPNIGDMLRDTFESSNIHIKSLMAQTVSERIGINIFDKDETRCIMRVRDLVGDKDIGIYANIPIPDDIIGNPQQEAEFLNRLGVNQYNHHHNPECAAHFNAAAIDHLENALQNESMDVTFIEDRDILRQVGNKRNRLFPGYASGLYLYYRNLELAYTVMLMLPKIRDRMLRLEKHCKINPDYSDMVNFTVQIWRRLGEPERGADLQKFVSEIKQIEDDK